MKIYAQKSGLLKLAVICFFVSCSGGSSNESKVGALQEVETSTESEINESATEITCYTIDPWQESLLSKEKKSVKDYYLLLPKAIFYCEPDDVFTDDEGARSDWIEKENLPNGYIETKSMQVALFVDKVAGGKYIGFQRGKSGMGTTCGGVSEFFQFNEQEKCWEVVTDQLLPDKAALDKAINDYQKSNSFDMVAPYFVLPEHGTMLIIRDEENQQDILMLKWNGSKFNF